ncbi:alpha/beta hydrolase [Aliidongia dinghuensis]|uniref:Alpha/beta hydrolase n=1 Tax=Aliidongia dinghuensis TaxID=1867774 RepID=A0A8J2Z0L6_9PROT|nr:alpha/beta hydrolase [Aliidongia dinghuensis]GGF45108.1 alpha/beta hydrolase [Aliidongia dinghuensis]
MPFRRFLLLLLLLLLPPAADAAAPKEVAYGPTLEHFDYPYPVKRFAFQSENVKLDMAYMDVPAVGEARGTAVLLHGKNFCAATWEATIRVLSDAGYRVVAPDQIGFCKSTKPQHYQYSFQQLARNTNALLQSLGIDRAVLIGHSTGGMLAVRYALMYPGQVSRLMLVDPIGLEDWKAIGVPWQSVDQWYGRELKTSAEGIRAYEQATYYAGDWRPEFGRWVDMLAGMYRGPGRELVAWNSALLYDMIFTQPVLYELDKLAPPTVLFIGDKDTTAVGKDLAPPEVHAKLGDYPALGRRAVDLIPKAKLVEFPTLGHAPQIQDPDAFHKALLENLTGSAQAD